MKRMISGLVGLAVGLTISTAGAATKWNMATPYPDATFHTQNINQFAKDVDKASNGELKITVHSGGSLFKHPQIKRSVQRGLVPIGELFISILGNEDAIYTVDSIPFLATNYDQAAALWKASRPHIEKRLEEDGLKLLYAVPWPAQGLYSSKPVTSVEDMKGLRFRAYNSATSRMADLTGAVATQVEVPEIPTAFATGIIEAMITSPSTGVNSKAWDFVKNFYDIQAWIPKNMVIVNKKAFDKLDAATQEAVLKSAKEAEARGWKMSMAEAEEKKKELAANGMTVAAPSAELQDGLAKVGKTMVDEWLEKTGDRGQDVVKQFKGM